MDDKWLPIMFRAPKETKELLLKAMKACGLNNLSAFVRQAAVEKANRLLGQRPTLPVYNPPKKPKGEVH
jgi:uncharacterized protein (DUF1778 family)